MRIRPSMRVKGFFWLVAGIYMLSTETRGGAPEQDPYATILSEQSIEPTAVGMTTYLQALIPNDQERLRLAGMIDALASDDYIRRDAAMRDLIRCPIVPAQDLRDASQSEQIELRLRARQVLSMRSAGNGNSSLTVACFRTIAHRKLTGMARTILAVLPLYCEEFVQSAGQEALRATCTAGDLPLLREQLRGGAAEARVAAVGALAALLGTASSQELHALASEREPRVKLAAARALAESGDRACLLPLVELLSCDELRVRHMTAATLRAATGRISDYVAWAEPQQQRAAIDNWGHWLKRHGASVTLRHPLKTPEVEMGRTLICLYARNEVIELDGSGNQTFSVGESGACPWACQGLNGGGRIVALYSSNAVIEYGPDGKERVRIAVPAGPMGVQRLESGHTLVASNNAQKVVEVNDQGKVLWEISLQGGPCDAQRLDNGNTLVTLQNSNSVVEIDAAGKEVWRVDNLHTPRSAVRLDNGNTLVCDLGSGRVIEFDPAAREVWSQDGFSSPFGAQRLSTGTTLVSDTQSVKEIDHAGKVLWEQKMASLGRVWRY